MWNRLFLSLAVAVGLCSCQNSPGGENAANKDSTGVAIQILGESPELEGLPKIEFDTLQAETQGLTYAKKLPDQKPTQMNALPFQTAFAQHGEAGADVKILTLRGLGKIALTPELEGALVETTLEKDGKPHKSIDLIPFEKGGKFYHAFRLAYETTENGVEHEQISWLTYQQSQGRTYAYNLSRTQQNTENGEALVTKDASAHAWSKGRVEEWAMDEPTENAWIALHTLLRPHCWRLCFHDKKDENAVVTDTLKTAQPIDLAKEKTPKQFIKFYPNGSYTAEFADKQHTGAYKLASANELVLTPKQAPANYVKATIDALKFPAEIALPADSANIFRFRPQR